MLERAVEAAELEVKVHPHMLRHACSYALANRGHDKRAIQGWMGHRSITSTAIYTALASNRFKDFCATKSFPLRVTWYCVGLRGRITRRHR